MCRTNLKICQHWYSVWKEQNLTPGVAAERLILDFVNCIQGQWTTPDFEAVRRSVRHCSGKRSEPVDSWGNKGRAGKGIATWYKLSLRPLQNWKISPTASIGTNDEPDQTKFKTNIDLMLLADTRPLSVMSVFWYIWADLRTAARSGFIPVQKSVVTLQALKRSWTNCWTLDSLPLFVGLKLMTAWCTCHRCVFGANWLAPWAH